MLSTLNHYKYLGLLALGLLFFNPVMAADLDCSTAININVPVIECEALLDLYDSTNGENWFYTGDWDTDTDICTRHYVTCSNIGGSDHVTQLFFNHVPQMNGSLPASLSGLIHITNFRINNEGVVGPLPSERSTWENITSFDISQSSITGPLPSERSAWENIYTFNISFTPITGPLPSERSAWTNIHTFNIGYTSITGPLPSQRSEWSNIYTFNAIQTSITGPLPNQRSDWSNIHTFNMLMSSVGGELPSQRSTWTGIVNFAVGDSITGPLPSERSAWTNINWFVVDGDGITGPLPSERSTWTDILEFRLEGGTMSGELPSERSTWTKMTRFWLDDITVSGTLPSARSGWTEMDSFLLRNITVSGPLPSERSTWTKIRDMGIINTLITGELPSERSAWTSIQGISIVDNQNLGGSLPSTRGDRSNNIRWVTIKGNNIGGFLPDERGYRSSLESMDLSNNRLYGHIPDTWVNLNFNNGGGYKIIINNNCLRDHDYTTEQEDRIQAHTIYYPQNDCAHTDISITKNAIQDLVDTGSTINYEISYYNSGFDAFDVVIYENTGTGLSIQSASESYTVSSNEQYGVPGGDLCYDQLYYNNTGYYLELLDAKINDDWGLWGITTLEQYIQDRNGYMDPDRGAYWIDEGVTYEGYDSFQALMIGRELDMTANPDCGYVDGPVIYTYVFSLGDILANTGGLINIVGHIAADIDMNQNFIQNTVTVSIANPETDYDNNQDTTTNYFTFSPPVYGCTDSEASNYNAQADEDDGLCEYTSNDEGESSGGGGGGGVTITQDDCPDGDLSESYYDGTCEQSEEEEELMDQEINNHGSASTKTTNRCDTYQEKVMPHTFIDIKDTAHKGAIELLIDNCLVHGYYNQGVEYGTNDSLKRGELYKVFARLSKLPFSSHQGQTSHRSDRYLEVGNDVGLRDGIDTSKSAESPVSKQELLQVAINYMKAQGHEVQLPENYSLGQGIIKRGEFASFIEKIIVYNTTQENQSQDNATEKETIPAAKIEEEPYSDEDVSNTEDSSQKNSYHKTHGERSFDQK